MQVTEAEKLGMERIYSVREVDEAGGIRTVGTLGDFATRDGAHRFAANLEAGRIRRVECGHYMPTPNPESARVPSGRLWCWECDESQALADG